MYIKSLLPMIYKMGYRCKYQPDDMSYLCYNNLIDIYFSLSIKNGELAIKLKIKDKYYTIVEFEELLNIGNRTEKIKRLKGLIYD